MIFHNTFQFPACRGDTFLCSPVPGMACSRGKGLVGEAYIFPNECPQFDCRHLLDYARFTQPSLLLSVNKYLLKATDWRGVEIPDKWKHACTPLFGFVQVGDNIANRDCSEK